MNAQGLFVPASSVSSGYNYDICTAATYIDSGESTCNEYETIAVNVAPLTPPFIYRWQCASVLLAAYVPVFIYSQVYLFAYPVMLIAISVIKYNSFPAWFRAKVPGELCC